MARTEGTLSSVGGQVEAASGSIVEIQRIAAPYTTILNRAKMVDLSKDLMPRFGIERIPVQSIMRVDGESGPNGEIVWKPVNDKMDQIRMVGNWVLGNNAFGTRVIAQDINDLVEISFYGTGLNLLRGGLSTGSVDVRVSVDGGAYGANVLSAGHSVLEGRNYSENHVVNVYSGAFGFHTVTLKLFAGGNLDLNGFEILNTSSSIQLPAGSIWNKGKKLTQASLASTSYNSGFESGSLGSKGGRVVIYKKADGTTAKAAQATASTANIITGVDHVAANEEVIRVYNHREFGAGRSDDLSTTPYAGSADRSYVLDDGTTILVGSAVVGYNQAADAVGANGPGSFWTLHFVGTGLDMRNASTSAPGVCTVSIDGATPVSITSTGNDVVKIASGLPYGTHTAKILYTSGNTIMTNSYIVYGPKKPSIPAGAVELADYNVMADFVANATAGVDTIATGVLRKSGNREFIYSGTSWSRGQGVVAQVGGWEAASSSTNKYVELTFFGTGFDFRGAANTSAVTAAAVTLNGAALTSANFGTAVASSYGGFNFNLSAGTLSQAVSNTNGSGFRVSGLPLGKYTLRVADTTASFMRVDLIDIITPVHVHKSNGPFVLQNTLSIGSQGMGDLRKFGGQLAEMVTQAAQAVGVTSSPTAGTTLAPLNESLVTIKTNGNPIEISATGHFTIGVAAEAGMAVYVDGVQQAFTHSQYQTTATGITEVTASLIVPVSAGYHTVAVFYNASSGTITANSTKRLLKVREV